MHGLKNWFSKYFKLKSTDSLIIVGKVVEWQKHPNADRLRIVKLDTGSGIVEPVVCGATNFDVGDNVVFALPGAHIPRSHHDPEPKPVTLQKAVIRGVESQGMICSAYELGLSDTPGDGIMTLDPTLKLGSPFSATM